MNKWTEIYQRNLELDIIFNEKYKADKLIFEKNCLELLTEIGELANETKIFKYWSIKKPDENEVLEEYADCIMMTLYFFGYLNLELENLEESKSKDAIKLFNHLFVQSSKLMNSISEELVKDIFGSLLNLGNLLGFEEKQILEACQKKQDKVEQRLNTNY